MRSVHSITFLFLSIASFGQEIINWNPDYKLQLSDFQSNQTEINSSLTTYSVYSGSNIGFSFQMNSYQFMFTKNFNSLVKCIFNKKASIITASDSSLARQLVKFGQYTFDLTELYSRKFRMQMNEEKRAFSNPSFFQPIFNELQTEMSAEHARVAKLTDLGRKDELLRFEHIKILTEINALSSFCMECKPLKKD